MMREIVFYIAFNFHPYQIGKRYTLWHVANSGLPGRVILLVDFHQSALIADVNAVALQQSLSHLEASAVYPSRSR